MVSNRFPYVSLSENNYPLNLLVLSITLAILGATLFSGPFIHMAMSQKNNRYPGHLSFSWNVFIQPDMRVIGFGPSDPFLRQCPQCTCDILVGGFNPSEKMKDTWDD